MWCSTFTTITRDYRPNISKFENKWRTNKPPGRSQTTWSYHSSGFSYKLAGGVQKSRGRSIVMDFQLTNIHTGWYVTQSLVEVSLTIARVILRVMIRRVPPTQLNTAAMDFYIVERIIELYLML